MRTGDLTEAATSPSDFMVLLRQLKADCGMGYKQLEKRAERRGLVLPHSSLATALGRDTLPRRELVAAFVVAAGCDAQQTEAWLSTFDRLCNDDGPETTGRPAASPIAASPIAAESSNPAERPAVLSHLLPPVLYRAGVATRIMSVVLVGLVVAVLAGAAAMDGRRGSDGGPHRPGEESGEPTPDASKVPDQGKPAGQPRPVPSSPSPRGRREPAVGELTVAAIHDTTIHRGAPNSSYGTWPEMNTCGPACAGASLSSFQRSSLIRFPPPAVPAGRCISTLRLNVWAKLTRGRYAVHEISSNWNETAVNWNNRPPRNRHLATMSYSVADAWVNFALPTSSASAAAFEIDGDDNQSSAFGTKDGQRAPTLTVIHRPCEARS